MAKAKKAIDYEIQSGTVIEGALRRKGEIVSMTETEAAGLLAIGKIRPRDLMEERRKRIADRSREYRRRDMNPEE